MRRLTILLAAVGALMLLTATSASAEGIYYSGSVKVNVAGNGSGTVKNLPDDEFWHPSKPPINCSYNGTSKSGACEGELAATGEPEEEQIKEGLLSYVSYLEAIPAPGSELVGFEITSAGGHGSTNCPHLAFPNRCVLASGEEEDKEFAVLVTFAKEVVAGNALTVVKEGTGSGTVVSNPAGVECGATCVKSFEANTKVTLTASPSSGSTFVSWKGCEKGGVNGRQCTVTMDAAKTVNAKFLTAYDVTVNRVGSGLGKVSSSPGGVLCLSNCSSTTAAFKEGTSVTLSAAASKNYVFTEWTGDCSGSSPTCSLGSLGANKTVGAKFTAVGQHNLTVFKSGGGNGTVKSNLAGINCGATCSSMAALYFEGQEVELSATPGKGSTFGGWSGSGCSGTGTCKVTINTVKSVTAEFK